MLNFLQESGKQKMSFFFFNRINKHLSVKGRFALIQPSLFTLKLKFFKNVSRSSSTTVVLEQRFLKNCDGKSNFGAKSEC